MFIWRKWPCRNDPEEISYLFQQSSVFCATKNNIPFCRYRALKYATSWWRHVTHDDITMTSLACTHYFNVLFTCAKVEANHMNRSVKFDEQNKNWIFKKIIKNQPMTSLWRHFRFGVLVLLSTYPPSFMTIGPSLICVVKNRIFDDVIMTSCFFVNYVHKSIALRTEYKKNFEFTTFR